MTEVSKGYREDGQFCFIKAFDLCEEECSCESLRGSEQSERLVKVATMMMQEHEDIFEDR